MKFKKGYIYIALFLYNQSLFKFYSVIILLQII